MNNILSFIWDSLGYMDNDERCRITVSCIILQDLNTNRRLKQLIVNLKMHSTEAYVHQKNPSLYRDDPPLFSVGFDA